MENLKPVNGHVLIELLDQYEFASTPDKEYATKTSGIVRAVDTPTLGGEKLALYKDRKVWFASYQDDVKIERDGKNYTFVKFDDLKGFDNGKIVS